MSVVDLQSTWSVSNLAKSYLSSVKGLATVVVKVKVNEVRYIAFVDRVLCPTYSELTSQPQTQADYAN